MRILMAFPWKYFVKSHCIFSTASAFVSQLKITLQFDCPFDASNYHTGSVVVTIEVDEKSRLEHLLH